MCCANSDHSITHWELKTQLPKGIEQNAYVGKQGEKKNGYYSKYFRNFSQQPGKQISPEHLTQSIWYCMLIAGEIMHYMNMKLLMLSED